jgi:HAMP domain-containing protein
MVYLLATLWFYVLLAVLSGAAIGWFMAASTEAGESGEGGS